MKILDISQLLDNNAEWPGDTPYERSETLSINDGYSCNLSSIRSSLHNGTHADAHIHYHNEGISIDQHDLEAYMGKCQVIHVMSSCKRLIEVSDIQQPIKAKRILFRTKDRTNPEVWDQDFKAISPELIQFLSDHGVVLIGTDAASVDLFESKTLESHQKLLETNIYNLENLVLDHIDEGVYQLVALPLKIKGGDASPLRAVLIKE